MAKKKRRNEARLKVIAGGAGPKAVVAKPARAPRASETNVRPAKREPSLPQVQDEAFDRVSAVEPAASIPPVAPFPRWIVPAGIAAVVGVAAWVFLSRSTTPPNTIPPPTAFSAWPSSSASAPVASQTAPIVETASVSTPALSASAPAASASAPAASASAPAASASAPASALAPTVSASAAAVPKPKAAPKPAPPSDDPYQ